MQAQLTAIVAQQQAEAARAEKVRWTAGLAAVQAAAAARTQTTTLAQMHNPLAWAPVMLSGIILVVFEILIFIVMTSNTLATNSLPLANVMLGTVAAMATQVANYWLGSSSGSAAKSDQITALSAAAQTLVPSDVVHHLMQQAPGPGASA